MAQTGFTPIQLYRTTTASAVPVAGNLAAGELAINLTDKKLYAKDASNNVFVLADASSGGTTATNLAGGAAGSLPYQTGANATTFRAIGTAGQVLQVNSGATAPEWVSSSGTGNVARTTSPSFTTPSLGAATATSINGLTLTSSTGALTVANGKTLTANSTLTLAGVDGKTLTVNSSLTLTGTDATTMTFPTTSATLARTDAGQTFTGTNVFSSAPQVSTLTSTRVVYAGASGVLQDNANLTFDGTSLTMGGNPTLSAGTANGVLYLNGSKVVTSGSALTFDGTNFATTGASTGLRLIASSTDAGGSVLQIDTTATAFGRVGGSTTMGYVAGTQSLWTIGGSEQMRLTSTGLGIGTSSPGNKLHVDAGALAPTSGAVARFDTTATTAYNSGAFVGGQLRLNYGNATSSYGGINFSNFGATNQEFFGVVQNSSGYGSFVWQGFNGTYGERMRLDSSGNLGLGVTPSFRLDVTDAASPSPIRLTSAAGTSIRFDTTRSFTVNRNWLVGADHLTEGSFAIIPSTAIGGGTFSNSVYAVGSNGIHTWSNGSGSELMRLNSTGLGIGTSSPANKLSLSVSGVSAAIDGVNITNGTVNGFIQTTGASYSYRGVGANYAWLGSDGAGPMYVGPAQLQPLVLGSGAFEYMRLDASGNLGLGATPSAWGSGGNFELVGAAITVNNGVGAYGINIVNNAYYNGGWKYKETFSAGLYQIDNSQHKFFIAPSGTAGNAISFTQAMTLDASGNLLVGATSKTAGGAGIVDIRGGLTLSAASAVNGGYQQIDFAAGVYAKAAIRGYSTGTTDAGELRFYTSPAGDVIQERARLDSSGNLGLGVTPSAWATNWKALQIGQGHTSLVGRSDAIVTYYGSNWLYDGADKYIASGFASVYTQQSGQHIWLTAPSGTAGNAISFTQAMTLDASGNLALGQTSAAYRLDVLSGADVAIRARTSNNSEVLRVESTGTATAAIRFLNTANNQVYIQSDSGALALTTGNTERARIPAAGGMVVGTAALATTATDGFLYVPTCAGTPTGTPTTQTGTAPIVVDTTNNKLYFYSGGQWRDAGP
jgi:hypothetical protein